MKLTHKTRGAHLHATHTHINLMRIVLQLSRFVVPFCVHFIAKVYAANVLRRCLTHMTTPEDIGDGICGKLWKRTGEIGVFRDKPKVSPSSDLDKYFKISFKIFIQKL